MLWLIVTIGTVQNMLRGRMFEAPCLREMEKAFQESGGQEQQMDRARQAFVYAGGETR